MKQIVAALSLLLLSSSTKAQSLPITPGLPFKIYDTRTERQITLNDVADRLDRTDVVFWGEEHDDTIGHILELKMLKLLTERHQNRVNLSLEMFERDCQTLLDEYLGGFISEEKFLKDSRPWKNYNDYKPMVEFAKAERLPVVAANSPRRLNSLVTKRGVRSLDSLGAGSKSLIGKLPIYVPKNGKYYKKFVGIMGGEENIHSPNMYASQCLWDATMAKSIAEATKDSKKGGIVMHVCGRFHSDEYLGTVAQLLRKENDLNVATISCFVAEDFAKPNWDEYYKLADYVIVVEKTAAE